MYTRAKVAGCIIPCDLSSRAEQPHPISHPISYPSASTAIGESSSYPINDPLVKQLYHGCAWRTFCAARQLEAGQVAIVPASCQLSFQAGMRPAIRYGQAAISDQLSYQLSYGRRLTGGRSPVVWPEVWSEMWLCEV